MNVLVVITKGNLGGAQRYVADLAVSLTHEGVRVSVACGEPGWLAQELSSRSIPLTVLPRLGRDVRVADDLYSLFDLLRIIRRERPDVLHLNSTKAAAMGVVAGRLLGVPRIITTVHGFAFKEDRNVLLKAALWLAQWLTTLLSHRSIVVCDADEESGKKLPWCRRKIVLIHNGIEEFTRASREGARREMAKRSQSLAASRVWVGVVAELNRNKGIDILIDAWREVGKAYAGASLCIVGTGVARQELKRRASGFPAASRIHFIDTGGTPARNLMSAFDVFALPSRKEGLPYVLLEAGMAALPCIASRVGGNPDIVEHGVSGLLFPAGDVGALAEGLEDLLAHPEVRVRYGRELERRIHTSFTRARMVRETLKEYRA